MGILIQTQPFLSEQDILSKQEWLLLNNMVL